MLKLVLPEEKYWHSFQEALQEFKNTPSPYDIYGIKNGFEFDNFVNYKTNCENMRLGIELEPGYVPASRLWLIEDDKFIGLFDIRHSLNDALKLKGGHIGFSILPSARKNGFATKGLQLCCLYAHDELGIENVLVTCNAKNIASYKTIKKVMIENCGSEIETVVNGDCEERRIWIRSKPRPVQIRPLAVAVIRKDNKILALKGYDDKKAEVFYRLIGGGIDFGEKGADTIKREFMEEFGFEPINMRYLTTVENIFTFNSRPGHEIVLVYEADLPVHLADKEKFYGVEQELEEKFAEFVEVDKNNKIYPEGWNNEDTKSKSK